MSKILIKNIKGLVQAGEQIPTVRKGADMKQLDLIEDAFLALEDGEVIDYGKMSEWEGFSIGAMLKLWMPMDVTCFPLL